MTAIENYTCDGVVIGAGVIGLAVARQLALRGLQPIIVESHSRFGEETSSRNSEVIHAGLYYPTGSLKAKFCVSGRARLYAYCEEKSIPHRKLGKLVVATSPEREEDLHALLRTGRANGVDDLELLSRACVSQMEPALAPATALFSPSTGIIDSHQYMLALLGDAEAAGASISYQSMVTRIERDRDAWSVRVSNAGSEIILQAPLVINCAGLWSQRIAARTEGLDRKFVPDVTFAKGSYVALSVKSPFHRLIYPTPEPGGLGVHVTIDMGDRAKFGPDVDWLEIDDPAQIGYAVDADLPQQFLSRIRDYWPGVREEMLSPAYAGVRPKLAGRAFSDFRIDGPQTHGQSGLINLFGIESPGLTSSLALAEAVADLV